MSKGPGRIERAIAELLDREADNAFTTEERPGAARPRGHQPQGSPQTGPQGDPLVRLPGRTGLLTGCMLPNPARAIRDAITIWSFSSSRARNEKEKGQCAVVPS